ncbi:hypothetical protein HKD42_09170 [Altererythrobacter sp. RZ02]|uniref:Uncharacterized protein n=1 Tax=Pontixanthobacter rizhaonensis TaxID=2730337 RepID=A0A848QSY8_9SPHN|nr:hypothetical protein [Pontixanthobacter rizhaonensis]NMW32228.1 hypothetical protein [Pontixanthobacter rizhaonensis]
MDLLLLGCFLFSFRIGAGPEKAAASTMVALFAAFQLYNWTFHPTYASPSLDYGPMLMDLMAAISLIVIAAQANRMYTLWLAGLQIIAVLAHLARGLSETISPIAYVVMFSGPSYFQIIILGFGIWLHHRRVKRHGNYRSWRGSSPLSSERQHPV